MSYLDFDFPHTHMYDSDLRELIAMYKKLVPAVEALESWRTEYEAEYAELKSFMDAIEAGQFPDSMYEAMRTWLQNNAIDIIGEMVKMVFFGITDDGYFVAYIPESWSDIVFGTTGLDVIIPGTEYGRLVLNY